MGCKTMAAACALLLTHSVWAEDVYYTIPLDSLTVTEGALPKGAQTDYRRWQLAPTMEPYAVLEGEGDAYVSQEHFEPWRAERRPSQDAIAIRVPAKREVIGLLFMPKPDYSGMVSVRFKIAADKGVAGAKEPFLKSKRNHYQNLLDRNVPGAAWFRHQDAEAAKALGEPSTARPYSARSNRQVVEMEETFALFSGGRALSENLQLDRVLNASKTGNPTVAITNVPGITTRAMDWKPLIEGLHPVMDPLAAYVPADQHAVFFPTFTAMSEMMEEADAHGTPVIEALEPRAEDANTRGRYQKQLCLELNEISRLLGPKVISSICFTGSDPYLRTGTDVGILFETKSASLLQTFIRARQTEAKTSDPGAEMASGNIDGVSYAGIVTLDRNLSSYVASLEEVVIVSNSTNQLGRLIAVAKRKQASLATQDEYIFFRNRYAKGGKDEAAFAILTDATIRRWCGPEWRIGNSRRTQMNALMAELQAAHLDELVLGKVKTENLAPDTAFAQLGDVRLTTNGIRSSVYGALNFLTPIAELQITKVSQPEVEAYERWRNLYQSNWRTYFDPIAIRFTRTSTRLAAEISVMPLITGTDYRPFISLAKGAAILPDAGDRHLESLLHFAMSINTQSELLRDAGNFLSSANFPVKTKPFAWLGESVGIYADADPFWDKVAAATNGSRFMETNFHQLPIALHCEVKNPLGLAAFLSGIRAYVQQTAPGMTVWQNMDYNGKTYVKVSSAGRDGDNELGNLAVYYATTPKSLVISPSETVLKRALDRQAAQERKPAEMGSHGMPWAGTNLCLQVNRDFLTALEAIGREPWQSAQQRLSWGNIPVLNEWKRLYPSHDPVKLHEHYWQTRLVCPGGGTYVWNEKFKTMESTVYGHPGEPKPGPKALKPIQNIASANLGINFETDGLSAKVIFHRTSQNQTGKHD